MTAEQQQPTITIRLPLANMTVKSVRWFIDQVGSYVADESGQEVGVYWDDEENYHGSPDGLEITKRIDDPQ